MFGVLRNLLFLLVAVGAEPRPPANLFKDQIIPEGGVSFGRVTLPTPPVEKSLLGGFPVLVNVQLVYLLTSSGPFTVLFEDRFCTGTSFQVWDNGFPFEEVYDQLNFCGVTPNTYANIVEPRFTRATYYFDAGYHNMTVLVYNTPLPQGITSLTTTIFPERGGDWVKNLKFTSTVFNK